MKDEKTNGQSCLIHPSSFILHPCLLVQPGRCSCISGILWLSFSRSHAPPWEPTHPPFPRRSVGTRGNMDSIPRLLITMGDVAGIGPEIIARAWPDLLTVCRPIVVGDPSWLVRSIRLVGSSARPQVIGHPEQADASRVVVPCIAGSSQDLSRVEPGKVDGAAGRAAYDFLCAAIDWTMAGAADGIVTAPLHKEGLRAAGLHYPGHTEILAERTGTKHYAMMLYINDIGAPEHGEPEGVSLRGLGVAHVTLHMALRDVFRHLSTEAVLEKIRLLADIMTRLLANGEPEPEALARGARKPPRIGVAALNPHASDGGLFGDEESLIIQPAVTAARAAGIDATGPWPADTLFARARQGEFDGIVAMYHDQGHIALKLMAGRRAVNICAGLPLVRTSVAHGTAYDIAGRGIADATGLVEAARVAAQLAKG